MSSEENYLKESTVFFFFKLNNLTLSINSALLFVGKTFSPISQSVLSTIFSYWLQRIGKSDIEVPLNGIMLIGSFLQIFFFQILLANVKKFVKHTHTHTEYVDLTCLFFLPNVRKTGALFNNVLKQHSLRDIEGPTGLSNLLLLPEYTGLCLQIIAHFRVSISFLNVHTFTVQT